MTRSLAEVRCSAGGRGYFHTFSVARGGMAFSQRREGRCACGDRWVWRGETVDAGLELAGGEDGPQRQSLTLSWQLSTT